MNTDMQLQRSVQDKLARGPSVTAAHVGVAAKGGRHPERARHHNGESLAKEQILMPQQCVEKRLKVDDHCTVHVLKRVND